MMAVLVFVYRSSDRLLWSLYWYCFTGLLAGWYDGCVGQIPRPEKINSFNFSLPFAKTYVPSLYHLTRPPAVPSHNGTVIGNCYNRMGRTCKFVMALPTILAASKQTVSSQSIKYCINTLLRCFLIKIIWRGDILYKVCCPFWTQRIFNLYFLNGDLNAAPKR